MEMEEKIEKLKQWLKNCDFVEKEVVFESIWRKLPNCEKAEVLDGAIAIKHLPDFGVGWATVFSISDAEIIQRLQDIKHPIFFEKSKLFFGD